MAPYPGTKASWLCTQKCYSTFDHTYCVVLYTVKILCTSQALAQGARGAVADKASRLRSDRAHAPRCLFAAAVRTDCHNSFCKSMQGEYKNKYQISNMYTDTCDKRIGKVCQLECATGVGDQREDLTIPELGLHFDDVIGALDEIGDSNCPALVLGEDGRVKTALQEKVFAPQFAAWLASLTRLVADKRAHHSPAVVTPLAVSAGGGMFPEDDDKLPCAADRNTNTNTNTKYTCDTGQTTGTGDTGCASS